jgi:hypothetical protein
LRRSARSLRPASYAKAALLLFGAGLLAGLAAVVFEIGPLQTPAAAMMALALFAIPFGMLVDWRRATRGPSRPPPAPKRKARPRPAKRTGTGAGAAAGTRIARGTSAGEVRWRKRKS